MAQRKMTQKMVRNFVDRVFYTHSNGRQFPIFDLAKISAAGIAGYLASGEAGAEQAVKEACDKYACKPGADEAMTLQTAYALRAKLRAQGLNSRTLRGHFRPKIPRLRPAMQTQPTDTILDSNHQRVHHAQLNEHDRATAVAKLENYIAGARERSERNVDRILSEVPVDRIVPGAALRFDRAGNDGQVWIKAPTFNGRIHDNAMSQLTDKMGFPMAMVRHLQGLKEEWAQDLLAKTLTDHAANVLGSNRYLVRGTSEGIYQAKAFLSDKFRRIDCRPGLDALIGVAQQNGAVVSDAVVSEVRASVRIILPRVVEIAPGEYVVMGLSWANSDYGRGAQSLAMFLLRLWCLNGAMLEQSLRQVHLGARLDADLTYSERTMRLDALATTSAIKDAARVLLSPVEIDKTADLIRRAANEQIDPKAKLADLRKRLGKGMSDKVQAAYTMADVEELPAGNTAWRMSNAISWVAKQSETTADDRLDLEREAGAALKLS